VGGGIVALLLGVGSVRLFLLLPLQPAGLTRCLRFVSAREAAAGYAGGTLSASLNASNVLRASLSKQRI
jgi:hypothetical protein